MAGFRRFAELYPEVLNGTLCTSVQHSHPNSQSLHVIPGFEVCPINGKFVIVQTPAPITTIAAPTTVIQMMPTQMNAVQTLTCTYMQPCNTSQSYRCRVMAGDGVIVIAVTSDMQWVQLHGSNTWIPRIWVQ